MTETIPKKDGIDQMNVELERHRLVHPVVLLQDLLAVEAGEVFGTVLGKVDDAVGADRAPGFAQVLGVTQEQIVLRAGEHLGGAGVALAGGAAEELAVDSSRAVRLGGDNGEAAPPRGPAAA